MISSFRYIVNSSVKSQNIHFTKFVSDISPGHHSESNLHTPVGHCRWGSPILPSALWSHPTHPRLRCNWWKFFFHPGATAPRSRCPCWICKLLHRTSYSYPPEIMLWLMSVNLWFRILSSTDTCMELVGAKPLHLLTQTVPSLKSPTGAFIASQTLIFRRKQIIRTHLLSETSSDYFCLVRVARIELTASWTPLCFSQKRNGHSDTTCTQYHQISKLFYHSVSLDVKMFRFFCGQIVVNRPWQMTILPY